MPDQVGHEGKGASAFHPLTSISLAAYALVLTSGRERLLDGHWGEGVETGIDMIIDKNLLDELTASAQASPRLRMNFDLRNSASDGSQRMLNALEPGTVMPIHRHHASSETVVILRGRIRWIFLMKMGLRQSALL